jgi:hypothetical protein
MDHVWTCRCCGKRFNTLQLDVAFKGPDHWFEIPKDERERLGKLDSDVCFIEKDIFVRGVVEIPIPDLNDHFRWGTWVSVSVDSFRRMLDLWTAPVIGNEPPKFAWFCNDISIYPETRHLKAHVHVRGGNKRPSIELEPTDHPLAMEQRQGITIARVEEILAALHQEDEAKRSHGRAL